MPHLNGDKAHRLTTSIFVYFFKYDCFSQKKAYNYQKMKAIAHIFRTYRTILFMLFTITVALIGETTAGEVEVVGLSKLGTSVDRALALSNALEAAVLQESEGKSCVKTFQILSAGRTQDGGYEVRIKAAVEPMNAQDAEVNALRDMARGFAAPRIAVKVKEEIEGLQGSTMVQDWLKDKLSACGLSVVEPDKKKDSVLIRRTELLSRPLEATMRREGIISSCDYLIEGTLKGGISKTHSIYGSHPMQKASLGLDIKLIDAATGNTILAENYPTQEVMVKDSGTNELSAREAVRVFMSGERGAEKTPYGMQLIHRMFAHWMIEKQEGAIYCIELIKMELNELQQLKEKLLQDSTISNIWVRSLDAAAVTIIDCETKLNADELAGKIASLIPDFTLDRSENRYLSFRQGDIITPIPETRSIGWSWIPWSSVAASVIAGAILAFPRSSYQIGCIVFPFLKRKLEKRQKKSTGHQETQIKQLPQVQKRRHEK